MWIGMGRCVAVRRAFAALVAVSLAVGTVSVGRALDPTTTRVSVGPDGSQASASTTSGNGPVISADGRFVAFVSGASNLSAFDTNNTDDIFVRDLVASTIERVSVPQGGGVANGPSREPAISADGRFVAFTSQAKNLTPGTPTAQSNVYVRDRLAGATERISVALGGGDANGNSLNPAISADGRLVAFQSTATNLVAGDTNDDTDVFIRDRVAGTTERVSLSAEGVQRNHSSFNPVMSGDGRYVAFESLVQVGSDFELQIFLRDRLEKTTQTISRVQGQVVEAIAPSMNGNGRYIAFHSTTQPENGNPTSGPFHIFLYDRVSGVTELISASAGGSAGNNHSVFPSISEDGRFVVFESQAANLVVGVAGVHSNILLKDRVSGAVHLISAAMSGGQGNKASRDPDISADGRFVTFNSQASNLVPGDTNNALDTFVRDRAAPIGLPQLSVQDVRVKEGSPAKPATLNVEVRASRRVLEDVTFRFWTENVTARDGGDYLGTFNTVTIPAGFDRAVIPIAVFGDTLFERDEELRLNIDTPNRATILDGQGVGVIENDDAQGVGTLDLTPARANLEAGDRILYALEWTVPSGSWRDLQTIELRFGSNGERLWVAFDERTRTLRLVDANGVPTGPSYAPKSQNTLSNGLAQVHLQDSRLVTSGPTSPTVRLELSLSFGPHALGVDFPVQVRATADSGQVQGFDHAGLLTVRP